ncbi:uncharacterized protein LOC142320193 [Lycorma delicatula]|uniref:uncharacterized protein LOC142320193 n=1 Tax=Lycorma delicatula TaxID=130591 RepID=UPI003F51691C
MIQVITVLFLYLQYGLTEPPSNSSPFGSDSAFSKNYVPPAANVSFNFGFSPKITKNKLPSDLFATLLHSSNDPMTKNLEQIYKNVEMSQQIDNINAGVALHGKHIGYNENNHSTKYNRFMNSPLYVSPYNPKYEAVDDHGAEHKLKYSKTFPKNLPIIEENKDIPARYESHHQSRTSKDSIMTSKGFSEYEPTFSEGGAISDISSYDFSYDISSPESGVVLGHHEKHDGSSAEGVYHNLLPDGRLLTVEYWADDSGFKPKITYKSLKSSDDITGYAY